MSLLTGLIVLGAVVLVYVLIKRFADAHERDAIRDLEKELAAQEGELQGRSAVMQAAMVRAIRRDATLFRSSGMFIIIVVVAAAGGLVFLQDLVDDVRHITDRQGTEIIRSCRADLEFRRLIDAQRTEDIRVKQAQRDALADNIAEGGTDTRDVPGFDQLPPSVQSFVNNLLAANVGEAQARLEIIDDDLGRLRAQVDEIRAFNLEQDCPGSR